MGGAGYGNHGDDAKPGRGEGRSGDEAAPEPSDASVAGPHATPSLTNPDATPGTGALPGNEGGDVDPGSG